MKIDVSKIEGYENMTAEEKIAALEAFEVEDNEETLKLKSAVSKSASEAAKYKKALQEKQTEQERLESERKEQQEALMNELETLRKEKAISNNKASILSLGYSEALAETSAKAFVEGDAKSFFADMKKFLEELKKNYQNELLTKQPELTVGKKVDLDTLEKQKKAELEKKIDRAFGL